MPTMQQLHIREHAKKRALDVLFERPPWTKIRYMEKDFRPTINSSIDRGRVWVGNYWSIGLRLVGYVMPELRRGNVWQENFHDNFAGWFLNDEGLSSKDGEGLTWGAVFQLPTRHHKVQFVAGYYVDGLENLCVDLSRVYRDWAEETNGVREYAAAKEAARAADGMAATAAEEEREYRAQFKEEED